MLAALCSMNLLGQKETRETFNTEFLEAIHIYADEVNSITIETHSGNQVVISTHSEGEYYNRIGLITEMKDGKLILRTKYPQALSEGYDKLSAHKVFAIDLEVEIPAGLRIFIQSNLASVIAKGDYEIFEAELNQGYLDLKNFSGSGSVQTIMGDISVEARNTRVEAQSRNGKLQINPTFKGNNLLKLTSVNGDISLLKTK